MHLYKITKLPEYPSKKDEEKDTTYVVASSNERAFYLLYNLNSVNPNERYYFELIQENIHIEGEVI